MSTALRINQPTTPATSLPTLALCMIVKDEAATLGTCLASVRGLVDEIVVVDTGSSDATLTIARAAGARVEVFPWCDDFAAARNAALSYCTADWVLVLDADEVLDPVAFDLRTLLAEGPAIYTLDIVSDIGPVGTIESRTPRLFPRAKHIRWHGTIHENPVDETGTLQPEPLAGLTIRHSGYRPEVVEAKGKTQRNVALLQTSIANDPHNAQKRLYLAQVYHQARNYQAAIEQARMALYLARVDALDVGMFEQAAVDVVTCLSKLGHFEQAVAEAQACLRIHPIQHPAFWVTLGNTYNALDAFALGAAAFQSAIAYQHAPTGQCDRGCLTWMPHAGMGLALAHMDRPKEALLCLARALDMGCGDQQAAIVAAYDQVSAACQPPHATPCSVIEPVANDQEGLTP